VQDLEVAYINGVFYASVGGDMHQLKFNASIEVKNTNGILVEERESKEDMMSPLGGDP
jgi:hypothetical protein